MIKHHAKHLLMCSPMILLGIVLIATGSGAAVLVPIGACVAMMWVMMSAMPGHGGGRD